MTDHPSVAGAPRRHDDSTRPPADHAPATSSSSTRPPPPRHTTEPPTQRASARLGPPDRLVMTGQVDSAAARAFTATKDQLAGVRTVDLTHATFLTEAAAALLLRCLQHVHHRHPDVRLILIGASPPLLDHLDLLGVTPLLDVRPASHGQA